MLNEDRKMLAAVQREKERIAVGVDIITQALRKGGRIVFVGAGTSGRLGVARGGGDAAHLRHQPGSGAGDHGRRQGRRLPRAGKASRTTTRKARGRSTACARRKTRRRRRRVGQRHDAVRARRPDPRAQARGAEIIFVTCDPRTELQTFVDLTIAPAVGPEVIAGSTRLKAGTATKLVLNMLTTGAMIRIGKTYGNLMVDVQTGSEKLRDRARRIVTIVTGLEYDEADKLLKRAHWNVKAAIVMQKTGLPYAQALARLRTAHDRCATRIGEDIEPRLKELLESQQIAESAPLAQAGRGRDVEHHRRRRGAAAGTTPAAPSSAAVRSSPAPPPPCRRRSPSAPPIAPQDRRHPHRQRPLGTRATSPPKIAAFDWRVPGCRCARCVRASSPDPGSLNPMCPLVPIPRISRSMPPAAAIARS